MESIDPSPNTTRIYVNSKLNCLVATVALNSIGDIEALRYKHGHLFGSHTTHSWKLGNKSPTKYWHWLGNFSVLIAIWNNPFSVSSIAYSCTRYRKCGSCNNPSVIHGIANIPDSYLEFGELRYIAKSSGSAQLTHDYWILNK